MREHIYTQRHLKTTMQELLTAQARAAKEPKPMERNIAKEALRIPVQVARFVGERLLGGGWSELPSTQTREPKPPVKANLTYIGTPEVPDFDEAA